MSTPPTRPAILRGTATIGRAASAAGVMLAATVVANAANYAYSLVMGRQLGPVLFGELTALLAILMVISVGSQSVQTVVARYVTSLRESGDREAVADFVNRLFGRLTALGLMAFAIWLPCSYPLARALGIHVAPVIIAGTALVLAFSLPVVWGAFQGEQRFRALGGSMVVVALGRFAIGVGLVAVGGGVGGAVGALTIATVVALLFAYPAVARRQTWRRSRSTGPSGGELVRYGVPTLVGLGAWTLLSNVDVVIVKAVADAAEAGYYGAAATIGKIALFLPLAVGLVIFPKTAARHVAGIDSRPVMRLACQVLALISAVLIGAAALGGPLAIRIMFGADYAPADVLVVPLVAAMCLFAICNVLLFYYLSVHRMRFAAMLLGLVAAQIVTLSLVASDPLMASYVQLGLGVAAITLNELFFVPIVRPLRGG